MKGKIAEVFDSVQGEGIYLGEKQIFVRFFGCNLSCKYCDTKMDCFTEYEPAELLEEMRLYQDKYHSISFTGGEPLLQVDFLKEILRLTRKDNFRHYLETNGTLPDVLGQVIDDIDIVAMDIKLPTSTGLDNFWHKHRKFLSIASTKEVFLKSVICDSTQEADLLLALELIKEINKSVIMVLQPNSREDSEQLRQKIEAFRDICIKHHITSCIIPQIHKVVGFR
ncbi:MAG: 7-carboxy-7-deazaguanine synthase QueE [Candidatus Omnitrophota bacterium]